jgi:hypothetical protein
MIAIQTFGGNGAGEYSFGHGRRESCPDWSQESRRGTKF